MYLEKLCRRRAVQERFESFRVRRLMATPFIAHCGQAFARSSIPLQGEALHYTLVIMTSSSINDFGIVN
jgi:hypothetical protein